MTAKPQKFAVFAIYVLVIMSMWTPASGSAVAELARYAVFVAASMAIVAHTWFHRGLRVSLSPDWLLLIAFGMALLTAAGYAAAFAGRTMVVFGGSYGIGADMPTVQRCTRARVAEVRRTAQELRAPGTEDATNPFFSMDGRWVGFFSGGKLKKVSLDGGAPVLS